MSTFSKADLDRAVTAERGRLMAVASSPAFWGREAAAVAMLTTTGMTAEKIVAALSGLGGADGDFQAGAAIAAGLPAVLRRS